jgi:hypothetical protein
MWHGMAPWVGLSVDAGEENPLRRSSASASPREVAVHDEQIRVAAGPEPTLARQAVCAAPRTTMATRGCVVAAARHQRIV